MNSILFAIALRSCVVLGAGCALVALLRKSSAATRNAVWRLTFVGLVLMPAMFLRLPKLNVPVEQVPVVNTAFPMVTAPVLRAEPVIHEVAVAPVTPTPKPMDWQTIFLVSWLVLSGLALMPLLCGYVSLLRAIRRSEPVTLAAFATLRKQMGIRRQVTLWRSSDIQTPATAGYFRAVVLIPESAQSWSEDRLHMVLRHELGHVQRGDWLAHMLAHLACVLYAPNPLVWIARAKLRAESEVACDDLVVASGVNATQYAKELLVIARGVRRTGLATATVGMAHRTNVENRLRAIVDPRRKRGSVSKLALWALSIGGVLAVGTVASLRLVHAQTARKAPDLTQFMRESAIRDDVSDHPDVPTIAPGAKFTVEPYAPSPSDVTVATNGVAHLPNGVTVALSAISPSATQSPVWDISNQETALPVPPPTPHFVTYGVDPAIVGLRRKLYLSIQSPKHQKASTMGYLAQPEPPRLVRVNGVVYGPSGREPMSNSFELGRDTGHTVNVLIAGSPKKDRITYRFGVAVGDWQSVKDVPNPYHREAGAKLSSFGGAVILNGIPTIIGPRESERKLPPNDRFLGRVNASDLVARRALLLDAKGDLIRGLPTYQAGWYPLSPEDTARCTHVVIQERKLQWAEFRDVPIRPTLEIEAKRAAGSLIAGTAKGIAPGYEKVVPGVGTLAISEVVSARKQGNTITYEDQPRWRADGKVLAAPYQSGGFPSTPNIRLNTTTIRFQVSGSNWHHVNTCAHLEGQPASDFWFPADLPHEILSTFPASTREVTVLVDICSGPWKAFDAKEINVSSLPDIQPGQVDRRRTGLYLSDGVHPKMLVLEGPTEVRDVLKAKSEAFRDPPANAAHRFVAVLKDGSRLTINHSDWIAARRGEARSYDWSRQFLASDVKEILLEVRPVTTTVRFEHVAVKPKP